MNQTFFFNDWKDEMAKESYFKKFNKIGDIFS